MKILFALTFLASCALALTQEMPKDYADVLSALGKKGDYKSDVLKVNIPRNDLKVRVAGSDLPTAFGFGGWIALTKGDRGMNVMMGDLVLLQEEVNPVMSALLDNGLEVTALHNHFFWDEPRIYYMHVHGMGTPQELARKVKPALDLIGNVPGIVKPGDLAMPSEVASGPMDTKRLDAIVGASGDQNGQVYKYTLGRNDLNVEEMGARINARMGLNSWAAFYGSDQKAVIAGDIAMQEGELTSVLKALRANSLQVVAIHHHMTGTRPMIVFLHYWGKGDPSALAKGFKAALDQLGKKHEMHMGSNKAWGVGRQAWKIRLHLWGRG